MVGGLGEVLAPMSEGNVMGEGEEKGDGGVSNKPRNAMEVGTEDM